MSTQFRHHLPYRFQDGSVVGVVSQRFTEPGARIAATNEIKKFCEMRGEAFDYGRIVARKEASPEEIAKIESDWCLVKARWDRNRPRRKAG